MKTIRLPAAVHLREFHGIHTVAPEMEDIFVKLRRVARGTWSVLLIGETGTGKELAARAIHNESPRRKARYSAINCATLSPTLLESELFGHVRGAFTGAVRDHPGLFRAVDGGTLFLDEVTEIPLEIQGKLLRVLQEKTFVAVGGTASIQVDVRVISAANRALTNEVAEGRFRADLSYRLRVVPLYLPPLRARAGDPEALFWHFLLGLNRTGYRRVERVASAVLQRVRTYPWPGNVRELQSALEYAFAVGEGPLLTLEDFTPEIRGESVPASEREVLRAIDPERARVESALRRSGGRIGRAAADLGISRQTLWRKLYALGLR